jgi:CRISPR system Cascade subunit CasB
MSSNESIAAAPVAASEGTDIPSTQPNRFDALDAFIKKKTTSNGVRSALARLDPDAPMPHQLAALSRALLAAGFEPERWQHATWKRWALIVHGIALAGHDSRRRLGEQLAEAGVSESRVTRLLIARGDAFTQTVPRLLRLLGSRNVKPNWDEFGGLILKESASDSASQQSAESMRLRIAGAYFSAMSRKAAA